MIVNHQAVKIEELFQWMGLSYQLSGGENFTVEGLYNAVCDVRNAFKDEVGTQIIQGKGKKKEEKQEKGGFNAIENLA